MILHDKNCCSKVEQDSSTFTNVSVQAKGIIFVTMPQSQWTGDYQIPLNLSASEQHKHQKEVLEKLFALTVLHSCVIVLKCHLMLRQ